jgi:DNA-binding NarL/FixJ family response regulator
MRVILVGSREARRRFRDELEGSGLEIALERDTLDDAGILPDGIDGILLAAPGRSPRADEESIEEPLTPREIEVLELMAHGLPNKSIAERLGISDQTVKFHTASIRGKLGARNRTEALRLALRRGLVSV